MEWRGSRFKEITMKPRAGPVIWIKPGFRRTRSIGKGNFYFSYHHIWWTPLILLSFFFLFYKDYLGRRDPILFCFSPSMRDAIPPVCAPLTGLEWVHLSVLLTPFTRCKNFHTRSQECFVGETWLKVWNFTTNYQLKRSKWKIL